MRNIAKNVGSLTQAIVFLVAVSFAASIVPADSNVHITGGNADQTTSPPTLHLIGSMGGSPVAQGFLASSVDAPTPDKEYQIQDGPHWLWELRTDTGDKKSDGISAITSTDLQGTVFAAQTSKAIQKGYTLTVTVYWTEVGMVGTPVQGLKQNKGPPSDTIGIQLTIVDEVLTVSDPIWGATKQDKDNDDASPPTPLSAGTRTQGSGADDLGGIEFSMSDLAGDATYDWAIFNRISGGQLTDDTTHDQPASGTFSSDDTVGARTFLPPGGYYIRLTKESDSNVKRLINFDVIGVHFQFAAVPTTQPTTQPVQDEKVYGGYTMLDQNASPTTAPSGTSNAAVVLEGPPDVQGTWKIDFSGSVGIWQVNPGSDDTKVSTGHASATITFSNTGSLVVPLKIQGLTASSSERDVSLKCTFTESTPTAFTMNDTANATVASVEILDAQAFQPTIGHSIHDDPAAPGTGGGMPMTGAWADGVSVLVVRMKPNLNAQIAPTFSVSHNNQTINPLSHATPPALAFRQASGYIGSLSSSFPLLSAVGIGTSVSFGQMDHKVLYWQPPNSYLFGSSAVNVSGAPSPNQAIEITAAVGGLNGTPGHFMLVRPAVMVSHGFDAPDDALNPDGTPNPTGSVNTNLIAPIKNFCPSAQVVPFDWNGNALSGLDRIANALVPELRKVITDARSSGIAATQLYFYGHSMSGIVCKWYMSNFGDVTYRRHFRRNGYDKDFVWKGDSGHLRYLRADNFGLGDVGRIATIGTPFRGSPWGNYLFDYYDISFAQSLLGSPGDGYSFADLRVDGLGFSGIARTGINSRPPYPNFVVRALTGAHPQVPWFPQLGEADSHPIGNLVGGSLGPLVTLLIDVIQPPSLLGFSETNSDWIVQEWSQSDGHAVPNDYHIVNNVVHTEETSSPMTQLHVCHAFDLTYKTVPGDGQTANGTVVDGDRSSGLSYFWGGF